MFIFKVLSKGIRSLSDREVLINDTIQFSQELTAKLLMSGASESATKKIITQIPEFKDKTDFLNFAKHTLKEENISTSRVDDFINHLSWSMKPERFRWNFKAFEIHNVKFEDLLDAIF